MSRVTETRKKLPQSSIDVDKIIQVYIRELLIDSTEQELESVKNLYREEYELVKLDCLKHPGSNFYLALSCLASAKRSPEIASSALVNASKHIIDNAADKAKERLQDAINAIYE